MSGRIAEQTVEAFLRGLASDDPTPGGGAVAALSGATGAALISMVCNLTIGKEGYEDVQERMRWMLEQAETARTDFLDRGSGRDRVRRRDGRVQDAEGNRRREGGPLQGDPGRVRVGRDSTAGDRQARGRTDGARARDHRHRQRAGGVRRRVRRQALASAVWCATYNVEINAAALKDPAKAQALRDEVSALRASTAALLDATNAAFASRIG